MSKKPAPTIEDHAEELLRQADELSRQYVTETTTSSIIAPQVKAAVEYGYILAGLRQSALDYEMAKAVVFQAMSVRFGTTEEEFATYILGA